MKALEADTLDADRGLFGAASVQEIVAANDQGLDKEAVTVSLTLDPGRLLLLLE